MRRITEKAYIHKDILSIDFKHAFDSIYRHKMIILKLQEISSILINKDDTWRLSNKSSYREEKERFNVNVGVGKGDSCISHFVQLSFGYYKKLYLGRNTPTKIVQINAYVDDVVKISRNVKALEEALQELDNKAHKTGVTINQEKGKYMRVRRRTIIVNALQ